MRRKHKDKLFSGSLYMQKAFRYFEKEMEIKGYFTTYGLLMYAMDVFKEVAKEDGKPDGLKGLRTQAEALLPKIKNYRAEIAENAPGIHETVVDNLNELEKICKGYVGN